MFMLRSPRSLLPFILASFGFTLIALAMVLPLFEWHISGIATDLPSEVHINPSWTTKLGESLESDSYILRQVVISKNGNSCSLEQITHIARRSLRDERLERIALDINQRATRWLTGLTFTGQITMAVILLMCGLYIWWFTILHNHPFSEAIISTVVAGIILALLINAWRVLVPETGAFVCRPELRGSLSFDASLIKVHYETLLVLFIGVCAEAGALVVMLRQLVRIIFERNKVLN